MVLLPVNGFTMNVESVHLKMSKNNISFFLPYTVPWYFLTCISIY